MRESFEISDNHEERELEFRVPPRNMSQRVQKAWQRRTFMEKTLLTVTTILTVVVISLIITVALSPKVRKGAEYNGPICRSKGCMSLSNVLQNSMDQTADPCEDFYAYSCGGWLKKHHVPPDRIQYGVTEMLRDDVMQKLKELLSDGSKTSIKSSAVEKALQFYNSCIDTGSIEAHETRPMIKLLEDIGGWPVANTTWNPDAYDWPSSVAKILLATGGGYIISITVGTDAKNTSTKVLQLDSPNLIFPRNILFQAPNSTEREAYRRFFRRISILLGAKADEKLNDVFEEIVQFEKELVEKMRPEEEVKDANSWYNKMNISKLQEEIPEVNWVFFLQKVTNSSLLQFGEKSVITKNDTVIIRDFQYVQNVSRHMADRYKEQAGKIRQVANYLGWSVIQDKLFFLPAEFKDAAQDYAREMGSDQEEQERWKSCTYLVNSAFVHVSSLLYVTNYFQRGIRNEVLKLVEDVRFEFGELIDGSDWMDPVTKRPAFQKLSAMKVNIGYPNWIADAELVDRYYDKIRIPQMTRNLFEDNLAITQQNSINTISTLREPGNNQGWPIAPITVNAAYNRNLNAITFPAAFLQWPLYNRSVPEYYNYAAIGSIIGHEITHGFDDEGRQRDAKGQIHDWWSVNAEKEFKNRTQCFINQYNAYGANGVKSLSENIADNGGLRQSYQTFLRWKETKDVELLPDFENFTPDQLFFLSYGSIWCTKYKSDAIHYLMQNDEHLPSHIRLLGTVSNLKEFSEAFECKASHNPVKRCVIW